ncbi:MAG: WYL domain-containing protein [Anaerolineae bacterium]|jgi:predicted DNA-binding transcriptional regulator YafY|nr:WYL domain-containing protein [Anaerolineae bacterium]
MRADRLISLMLLLHAHGRMTAADLARDLEVSERTIYRDLEALSGAGIPLYTQPGTHGGIFLDERYRISLTGLSRNDLQTLFMSSEAGPLKDLGLEKTDALLKLFADLPSNQRAEVDRVRQRFHIDPANWFQLVEPIRFFPLLQQAVWQDRLVEVCYQPVLGSAWTRVLEPYGLVAKANIWYLIGKKQGGDSMRSYRVVRFEGVTLLPDTFERDPQFDLAAYWRDAREQFHQLAAGSPRYEVVLLVPQAFYWYFPGYLEGAYTRISGPDHEGSVTLRVTFESEQEGQRRVLGMGANVRIIAPDSLRAFVIDSARALCTEYEESSVWQP